MIVNGEGDLNAKLWFIGEAPGSREIESGRPFQGGVGQVFDRLLRKVGINRNDCYIDNVIQFKPRSAEFDDMYEDTKHEKPMQELLENHVRIQELIKKHRPNLVVLLGNEALYAVFKHKGIHNWRGSILNFEGVKIIPSLSPSLVMKDPSYDPIATMDFNRIAEQAKTSEMPVFYKDNFIINPSFNQVMYYLTDFLPKQRRLAFDIETIPDMEQIMCLGIAWSKEDAICIPIFYGQNSWFSLEEELGIIKAIQNLFKTEGIQFIAQNAQYDMTYNIDKWNVRCKLWMDTMIAFHNVYPEMKKSLAFIGSVYTYRPYYKEDGGKGKNATEEWIYNCKDCCVTFESAQPIYDEMKEFGTLDHYYLIPHPLIDALMEMQSYGILVDKERRDKIDADLSKVVIDLQCRMDKAVGHPLNSNSPKQVKEFLYDELKLPPIYGWGKKDGKKAKVLSTDEDAIERLQKISNSPVLGMILEIRGINKNLNTYVRAELEKNDRMCCSYKLTGTDTGRLSARKSVYGRGTNHQNIPRDPVIRSMFIAEPGNILVNADLSQAEARIVAYIAREERMIRVFERKEDIHRYNASIIYDVHPNDVTPSQRQTAKARVHGANYRIGAETAAELAGTTVEKARTDLNKYKANFPMLEVWWKEVEDQMARTRIITNYFGRKRMFFGRWGHELVNSAIAYYPQSTVGDLLNLGIIRARPNLPQGWRLLANNHDSVLASVPEYTDHMHLVKFFRHYFEIPMTIYNRTFIIPMDVKVGKNWGEMKDIKL